MPSKVVDKEKKKAYDKARYHKNKDRLNEINKQYYLDNREKIRQQNRKRYEDDKERIIAKQKEYYQRNKEEIIAKKKTPEGYRRSRINNWKCAGIVSDDYDALYQRFISTENCEFCGVCLTEDKTTTITTRCLDHDHESGEVRGVLCNLCNIRDVLKES